MGLFLMGSSVSSDVAAQGAAQGGFGSTIIMIAVFVLIFYFLLIRPQKKRDAEAKKMMDALKKGDKVVTIGGIKGTVAAVTDKSVFVKIDDNAKIEFTKTAISQVINPNPAPAAAKVEKKADKKAEAPKAEEKKAEAKVEEVKVEEAKAEPAKKAPAKKAPAKKAPAKKAPAKKAPAKKAPAKAAPKAEEKK